MTRRRYVTTTRCHRNDTTTRRHYVATPERHSTTVPRRLSVTSGGDVEWRDRETRDPRRPFLRAVTPPRCFTSSLHIRQIRYQFPGPIPLIGCNATSKQAPHDRPP